MGLRREGKGRFLHDVSDGEFPEVLPVDSCSAAEGSTPAEEILSWVRKAEHVKIQSFIDERYAAYRESGIVLEGS